MTKIKVEISALESQASAPHWLSLSGRFPQERRNAIIAQACQALSREAEGGA